MFNSQKLSKYENEQSIEKYSSKMNDIYKTKMERFQELQAKVEECLVPIRKANVVDETNKNISHYHFYSTKLSEEKIVLNEYKNKKDTIEGELFDYYRNHSDISSQLRSESAISKYVYAHPCLNAINKVIKLQEVIVSYLDSVIIMIRDRGFAAKSIIEMIKIELGM